MNKGLPFQKLRSFIVSFRSAPGGEISDRAYMPLAALALPMYLENLLRTALSSVDVFMVSAYSDKAVAAVGLINQFTFFLLLVYTMVGSGASTLISQYLVIYGMGSVFVAFNIVQGTILRAYGYPRDTMWANMIANVCNVIGNAIALYGPFGIPVTGVPGVALSTVVSQIIACIILAVMVRLRQGIVLPWRDLFRIPAQMYRRLLFIGVPTAGENVAYSLMQMVIIGFIARVGTAAMNAHVYTYTIIRFVFMPALTIGAAGQIKVGYLVGAKKFDVAERKVWGYFLLSALLSMAIMSLCWIFRYPIIGVFTKDSLITGMVSTLFLVSFFREAGRISNIVVIPALKGAGDVIFPMICGLIFMWGVGVGGAWLLGLHYGLGLAGVWIAIAADEWLRGILIALRWRSGAWKSKALVHHSGEETPGLV